MNNTVTNIYFSPRGTTAKVAGLIASNIADRVETINLLTEKNIEEKFFAPSDTVIVAMPVFAGRIPNICVDMLKKFKGDNTPAIAAVVYGNRDYDDALIELTDILQENGFVVAGAGAFIARHSVLQDVAIDRPDSSDAEKIKSFAERCAGIIESGATGAISVPGKRPYLEFGPLPISPSVSSKCNECGACSKICPTGAIPRDNPHKTDKKKCINCTACIQICPQKARKYGGMIFFIGSRIIKKKCVVRLEPEFFYANKE